MSSSHDRSFEQMEMDAVALLERLLASRPAWWSEARCRGMAQAFTHGTHKEQLEVCHGAYAGGPCPVMDECREDLIERARKFGYRELNDGDLVCGGMTPAQLRAEILRRNRVQPLEDGVE